MNDQLNEHDLKRLTFMKIYERKLTLRTLKSSVFSMLSKIFLNKCAVTSKK